LEIYFQETAKKIRSGVPKRKKQKQCAENKCAHPTAQNI
jgi:hypothetical protein